MLSDLERVRRLGDLGERLAHSATPEKSTTPPLWAMSEDELLGVVAVFLTGYIAGQLYPDAFASLVEDGIPGMDKLKAFATQLAADLGEE